MTSVGYGTPGPRKKIKTAFNLVCFNFSSLVIQYLWKRRQLQLRKISHALQNCCLHAKRSNLRDEGGQWTWWKTRRACVLAERNTSLPTSRWNDLPTYACPKQTWQFYFLWTDQAGNSPSFKEEKNKFPLHWIKVCFQCSMVYLIIPWRDNL